MTAASPPVSAVPRQAWVVFAAGTFAYLCAVTQRNTIGVAGVVAAGRFDASAAALSTLGVAQLAVYAALQVPVGVLVDRFGPKRVLATGAVLMLLGQVVVALAAVLAVAVAGRMLVGAGDATTFVAVLRLVNAWFPGPRVPVLSQWVGNLGQLGQVLSAVPFGALLHLAGWSAAFAIAAALSGSAVLVILLLVRDGPAGRPAGARDLRAAIAALRASLARPGTRLGFWAHFVTQSSGVVFAILWGYPFLVAALGLPAPVASLLLGLQVVAGLTTGPVLGTLTARHPMRRSNLVLAIVIAMGVAWTLVLAWPGRPPIVLVVLLIVAIGVGGPGSQIGFDYARTFNPPVRLGGASGVVNVGGFTASFTMMFLIGVLLDAHQRLTGGALYSLAGFRAAFLVQYAVVGFGVVMLLRARRGTRRELFDSEGIAVAPLWRMLAASAARRRSRAGGGATRRGGPGRSQRVQL